MAGFRLPSTRLPRRALFLTGSSSTVHEKSPMRMTLLTGIAVLYCIYYPCGLHLTRYSPACAIVVITCTTSPPRRCSDTYLLE